jgi:hypothetical protein
MDFIWTSKFSGMKFKPHDAYESVTALTEDRLLQHWETYIFIQFGLAASSYTDVSPVDKTSSIKQDSLCGEESSWSKASKISKTNCQNEEVRIQELLASLVIIRKRTSRVTFRISLRKQRNSSTAALCIGAEAPSSKPAQKLNVYNGKWSSLKSLITNFKLLLVEKIPKLYHLQSHYRVA